MRSRQISVVVFLISLLASTLVAETVLDISGQVRVRNEIEQIIQDNLSYKYYYNWLRARVNILAQVDSNTVAYLSLQDSRNFMGESEATYSGDENNAENIDAHEAYLEIRKLLPGIWVKAGRFEFSSGNGRLFGVDDWDNVGRSWNGVQVGVRSQEIKVVGFGLAGPGEDTSFDIQNLIWGVKGAVPFLHIEPLFYYENSDTIGEFGSVSSYSRANRFTFAIFGKHDFGILGLVWNAAYQFGDRNRSYIDRGETLSFDYDIEAWMITAQLTGKLEVVDSARWCAGVDISSGNKGYARNSDKRFAANYRSHGDFFGKELFAGPSQYVNGWARDAGLVDLYVGLSASPLSKTEVSFTMHAFSTNRAFDSPLIYTPGNIFVPVGVKDARNLGWQPELSISTRAIRGLLWELGATYFDAKKAYYMTNDPKTPYYAYTQMTVDF